MSSIEIEFCQQCGLQEPALVTQERLLYEFDEELDCITLIIGDGGVFKVTHDDTQVWARSKNDGDIDLDRIVERVDERL